MHQDQEQVIGLWINLATTHKVPEKYLCRSLIMKYSDKLFIHCMPCPNKATLVLTVFLSFHNLTHATFHFAEHYQVKRTCTDDFDVNFFMVNHACMTEGHRHGHMCFCEEDECNTASSNLQKSLTSLGVSFAFTMLMGAFPRWLLNTNLRCYYYC